MASLGTAVLSLNNCAGSISITFDMHDVCVEQILYLSVVLCLFQLIHICAVNKDLYKFIIIIKFKFKKNGHIVTQLKIGENTACT
jgi:hypothetical protein